MNMKQICGAVALATVMTVTAAQAQDPAATPAPAAPMEKCYGVAKAGPEVAIELPAGVCDQLANGSLTAPPADAMKPAEKQ